MSLARQYSYFILPKFHQFHSIISGSAEVTLATCFWPRGQGRRIQDSVNKVMEQSFIVFSTIYFFMPSRVNWVNKIVHWHTHSLKKTWNLPNTTNDLLTYLFIQRYPTQRLSRRQKAQTRLRWTPPAPQPCWKRTRKVAKGSAYWSQPPPPIGSGCPCCNLPSLGLSIRLWRERLNCSRVIYLQGWVFQPNYSLGI